MTLRSELERLKALCREQLEYFTAHQRPHIGEMWSTRDLHGFSFWIPERQQEILKEIGELVEDDDGKR
jgi:hypothetical protein